MESSREDHYWVDVEVAECLEVDYCRVCHTVVLKKVEVRTGIERGKILILTIDAIVVITCNRLGIVTSCISPMCSPT